MAKQSKMDREDPWRHGTGCGCFDCKNPERSGADMDAARKWDAEQRDKEQRDK